MIESQLLDLYCETKKDYESWLVYESILEDYIESTLDYAPNDEIKVEIKKKILKNKRQWLSKQLFLFESIKEIIVLFCQSEIGSECEIDYDEVANYLTSKKFFSEFWTITDKEEIFKIITDDILNGLPIWNFIKMSDKRKKIISNSFENNKLEEKKQYLCYTCKNNYVHESPTKYNYDEYTGFSYINRCYKTGDMHNTPKKECKYYVKK